MANYGRGLHAQAGRPVDVAAYHDYIGRWSRPFVPALLAAAEVAGAERVLDLATGPGEAAALALSLEPAGRLVVGADVSPAMVEAARRRLAGPRFLPVVADGEALPFDDARFDSVICQLGLQFFPDPARGLAEMRRVLRRGRRAAACVIGSAERAPMWGPLADALSRHLPEQAETLHLSFALSDAGRVARLFAGAGFADVHVERETRTVDVESFDAYWASVEAGVGLMPQAYRSLSDQGRQAVREEVRARLAPLAVGRTLPLGVEMLIAGGRA
jgi:SAM-dependent methyltransferase